MVVFGEILSEFKVCVLGPMDETSHHPSFFHD